MKLGLRQKNAIDEKRVQVLLKEYELCTIDANHLEDSVWTTTGLLITASIAGIGFLSGSVSKTLYVVLIRMLIAILSIVIIVIWHRIVTRWYAIQQAMYYRTQEIEGELGMRKNINIKLLDDYAEKQRIPNDSQTLTLITQMDADHKGRTIRDLVPRIRWLLIFSWIAFVIVQLLALLHIDFIGL